MKKCPSCCEHRQCKECARAAQKRYDERRRAERLASKGG